MGTRDPRIDAYIAKSADFAQPILTHLRQVVHGACPDVEETMKWSMPHFTYRKRMLCGMASFKQHCTLGFWNGGRIVEGDAPAEKAMGQFGRITSLADLPADDVLAGYVRKAMELNDAGVRRTAKRGAPRAELAVPDYMAAALERSEQARATFEGFSPSQRREYVEWITEAKGDATRERRLATALEWMAEGKPRNWKYMKS